MPALSVIANCMEPVFCINFHGLMLWKKIESWAKFCARKVRKMHKIKLNTSHFFKFCHKINGHPYGTDFTFLCEAMFGRLMKIAEKKLPNSPWVTSKGYWKPEDGGNKAHFSLVELSCSGIPPASNQGSSRLWAKAFRQRWDVTSFAGVSGIVLTYTPTGSYMPVNYQVYTLQKTRISLRHLPSRCPKKCHSRSAVALSSPEVGTWLARCSACPCNDFMLWCRDAIFPGRVPVLAVTWFFFYKSLISLSAE